MSPHDHPAAFALLLALSLVVGQFGFFDFLGVTQSLLSSFVNFIINLLVAILNAILQLFVFIWNVLVAVFNFFFGVSVKQVGFARFIQDRVHGGFFSRLLDALKRLHVWLELRLAPLLAWLKKVRDWIDRVFNKYIRPILRIISKVRQVLAVLRLFGIDLARRIDRVLAQIQGTIGLVFATIRGALNLGIDWINALGDARKLARMIILVTAGRRAVALWTQITTKLPVGFFFPTPFLEGQPAPPEHERSCVITTGFISPTGNNLLDLLISNANLPEVMEADTWPGVDVDQLAALPYFDDLFYLFGLPDAAEATLALQFTDNLEHAQRGTGAPGAAAAYFGEMLDEMNS
jgi:hypothetical protein